MDDSETLRRRARLRELIAHCFDGRLNALLAHIEARTQKRPNQGELSALQKDHSGKSFGDIKARHLTEQIGLHRRWFDAPPGTHLDRKDWLANPLVERPRSLDLLEMRGSYDSSALTADERFIIECFRRGPEGLRQSLLLMCRTVTPDSAPFSTHAGSN